MLIFLFHFNQILDAFSNFLNKISNMEGGIVQDYNNPHGFAFSYQNGLLNMSECYVEDVKRGIQASISPSFCDAITGAEKPSTTPDDDNNTNNDDHQDRPLPGKIVALTGRTAMPCVCEAQAVDDDNGAKMVVEGVIWQSLYLVFFGSYMVFCEPVAGRYVVSSNIS